MLDRVFTTISRYNMLAGGERVIVAVSGGADSVCLLEVLACLTTRLAITLAGVAHFNHKLRGEDSEEDERVVAALAARHKVPFYRAEANLADVGGNLEQECRRARQRFFTSLISEGKADRVAVGHTRDDQSETVLLRLMRGSGLAGLTGVLPVTREGLIRPLLEITHAEVEAYLGELGISWRQDQSNFQHRFKRNRIRRDLLPKLASDYNPRISESLAQLAELALDEESWWSAEIARIASRLLLIGPMGVEVRAADLLSMPRAVGRRLVRHAIGIVKGDLRRVEFQHVEQVLALAAKVNGTGGAKLPGVTVTRSLDWLRLSAGRRSQTDPIAVDVPGCYAWPPANTIVVLEVAERKGALAPDRDCNPYGTLEVELSWDKLQGPLELRGYRPGDAYQPQGRRRVYRMTELFQDFRVPSWRREGWPILTCKSASARAEILWARGFGGSHEFSTGGKAGPVLRISEKQESFVTGIASY